MLLLAWQTGDQRFARSETWKAAWLTNVCMCRSSSVQNQASEPGSPAVDGAYDLTQLQRENEVLRQQLEDKNRQNYAVKEQAERHFQDNKAHSSQLQSQLEVSCVLLGMPHATLLKHS